MRPEKRVLLRSTESNLQFGYTEPYVESNILSGVAYYYRRTDIRNKMRTPRTPGNALFPLVSRERLR